MAAGDSKRDFKKNGIDSPESLVTLRVISLSLVVSALIWAEFEIGTPVIVSHWKQTAVDLLIVQAALCFLLSFVGTSVGALLSFVRFCLLLILGFPLGRDFTIEALVLCSILIDVVVLEPGLPALWIGAISVAVTVLAQRPFSLWGVFTEPPSIAELCLGVVAAAIVLALGLRIRVQDRRLTRQTATVSQLKSVVARISSANLGFQNYARIIESKSKEDERKRISREIHDTTGYVLTNIRMLMESALRSLDADRGELAEMLTSTKEQAMQGLEKTRLSMRNLRNIEYSKIPFHQEIHKIVSHFENATGTRVVVDYCNLGEIEDQRVRDILCAIIQEGMINALRHGNASLIHIIFWQAERAITLRVLDNGTGSDMINEGVGMAGMRERIASVDGRIAFYSTAAGFEIVATAPVKRECHDED